MSEQASTATSREQAAARTAKHRQLSDRLRQLAGQIDEIGDVRSEGERGQRLLFVSGALLAQLTEITRYGEALRRRAEEEKKGDG